MSEESPIILSSDNSAGETNNFLDEKPKKPFKKILLIIALFLTIVILVLAIYFIVNKYKNFGELNPPIDTKIASTTSSSTLPNIESPGQNNEASATSSLTNLAVEYISFADFYNNPIEKTEVKINDYQLPINVKLDVMNYYDVSRKINIDAGLNSLNENGFVAISNPWPKEAPDFYSVFSLLESKQLPIFVSSDFIIYYYQNNLKKAFKDIEENIFYDNLWDINKNLYTAAKNRYEARLASIGNINDSILEGERLEMTFFAVALELLKPASEQIVSKGEIDNKSKFVSSDVDRFYFMAPTYLRDDVLKEVKLIRGATEKSKSPTLLYLKDYSEFKVPVDYRANAKLNNFYLTTKWLNSVFPIEYIGKNCPTCLLDKEDGRISLIAASFIAYDFSNLPDLKTKWARIYKVMSFFKGLRDDLNYIHYRDSLVELFGSDYKLEEIFDDKNKDQQANLEKLRAKLLTFNFSEALGAYDKKNLESKKYLGFKMLVEPYWPNDYLVNSLIKPKVGAYLGKSLGVDNIVFCKDGNRNLRCNGIALDIINLAAPIKNNSFFSENSNYTDYQSKSAFLKNQLDKSLVWHTTNYWSNLKLSESLLNINNNTYPVFARTTAWGDKSISSAVSAWVSLQLPLEKFSVSQTAQGKNLNFSQYNENSYVEPNLELLNELIANNNMIIKMFTALRINEEINSVSQNLQIANNNLFALKRIVVKELSGVELSNEDNELISDFIKQWKIEPGISYDRQLFLGQTNSKNSLRENLNQLKLLIITHQEGNNKVFSVGPIWNNIESR